MKGDIVSMEMTNEALALVFGEDLKEAGIEYVEQFAAEFGKELAAQE
jgi:hypothetical protein